MVEKSKNKKYNYAITLGAITFIGVLIAFFAVLRPLYNKSRDITAEVKTKQTNLNNLKDKKQKLIALKEREDQLKEDAKKVENALPDNKEVGRLFIQIHDLATSSKGTINSVALGGQTSETTANISKISYNIPATFDSYFDLKDFITKSETALRIFDINSLTIAGTNDGGMSANFNANTYVRN